MIGAQPAAMGSRPPRRVHFLDGLRGYAATVVLLSHIFLTFLLNVHLLIANGQMFIVQMLIRTPIGLLLDGHLAVHLFFVISGFAVTYPLLIAKDFTRSLIVMAAFRYFRLAVPIFFACVLTWMSWSFFRHLDAEKLVGSGWLSVLYGFEPNAESLLRFSLYDVFFAYPQDARLSWNVVLWTMPIEMIGSFGLFVGLAIIRSRRARMIIAAVAGSALITTPFAGFPIGYLIADAVFLSDRKSSRIGIWLITLAVVVSIFRTESATSIVQNNIIAALALLGITVWKAAQDALSSEASRYMGRISFPLYLVHLPIIASLGAALYVAVYPAVGYGWTALIVAPPVAICSLLVAAGFALVVEVGVLHHIKRAVSLMVDRMLSWSRRSRVSQAADPMMD